MTGLDGNIPIQGDGNAAEEESKGLGDMIGGDNEGHCVYEHPISLDWVNDSQNQKDDCQSDR